MRFPKPRVPRNYFKWSLRNRQRFCKWIWNHWWKIKEFFEKRLTRKGLSDWWEATKFNFEVWRLIRKDKREWRKNHGKKQV